MDPILELADRNGLAVIEDAAEAHGARYKGRPVGSIGELGVFSFYGNKIVTTGEGGMIVTGDADLADRMRRLRDHGMTATRRYWHPELGYNYRMTNLQAAVGLAQMEKVDFFIREREKIGRAYTAGLRGIQGIDLPPRAAWADPVCWQYTIRVTAEANRTRDDLAQFLSDSGIETRPAFIPMHEQPIYHSHVDLPVSTELGATGLSLPTWVGLPHASIERIVELISRTGRVAGPEHQEEHH
jgi:perosamine synthetase